MDRYAQNGMSAEDIRFFSHIANRMVKAGLWHRVDRYRTTDFDFFDVHGTGNRRDPMFSIGRCLSGLYVIMDHRDGSVKFGNSLDEALGLTDWTSSTEIGTVS